MQKHAVTLDTLYAVETPEGIMLSLRPAGLVSRLLAYLIDLVIRLAVFIVLSIMVGAAGGMGAAFLLIAYFCLEWIYPVVFELSPLGATPGKRSMGLKVVMDSGLPVTPAASILRNLLRAADFFPFMYAVGAVVVLWRADFKRLGDMAAGTLVVYREASVLHNAPPAAAPLAPRRPLDTREHMAIVAWAGRAQSLTSERLDELAQLASSVVPEALPDAASTTTASQRLLGVAQWLIGRRPEGTP